MEDRSKHIDDLFREGLSDYKELPSANVWQSLEQRLPAAKQPSKRWMWWIVLAALLATLSYFIINKTVEKNIKGNNEKTELKTDATKQFPNSTTHENSKINLITKGNNQVDNNSNKQPIEEKKNTELEKSALKSTSHSKTKSNNDADNLTKSNQSLTITSTKNNGQKSIAHKASTSNHKYKKSTTLSQSVKENNALSIDNIAQNKNEAALPNSENTNTSNNLIKKSKNKTKKLTSNNKSSHQQTFQEHENGKTPAQSLSKNKTSNNKQKVKNKTKDQEKNNNEVAKNKSTNTNRLLKSKNRTEQNQKNITSNGRLINVNPDESSRKDLDIVSSGSGKNALEINPAKNGKKKPLDVNPATFKKTKPIEVKPDTSHKKSNIIVNGAPSKKKNIEPFAPAKETPKKTFEVTNSGVKIFTEDDDSHQTEEEPKTAAKKETTEEAKETEKPEEVLLATGSKPSPVASSASGSGDSKEPNVPLRNFNKKINMEGGIKAGYERGTNAFTNSSLVIAPFLQWNISKSFSVMLQPGFRYNQINRADIFDVTKSYHQINSASRDSVNILDSIGGGLTIQRNYIYKNFYDSIIVKNSLKTKNNWEIEIPIMLRFNAATNFAILGGLSLTFGNIIQIQENRTTITGLERYDSLSLAPVSPNAPHPQVAAANSYFNYNTADISTVPPPNSNQNLATNPPRLGLMLGFSYELQRRIMIDVMMKKNISDMKYIPNEEIRKIYTQPNFRVMVGYKLFNNDKDKAVKNPGGL